MAKEGISVRQLSGMTLGDGSESKVSPSTIMRIRDHQVCKTDIVDRIANALGVPAVIIFGELGQDEVEKIAALSTCQKISSAIGIPLKVLIGVCELNLGE